MSHRLPHILLYGQFGEASFEYCWLTWLQERGYIVHPFDHHKKLLKLIPNSPLRSFFWKFGIGILARIISHQLVSTAQAFSPDLVLTVSGNLITSLALQEIKSTINATLFHFYGEDFFNPFNTKYILRIAASSYDHFFTTKSFNIPELAAFGITRTTYIPFGYRPNCDYPVTVSPEDIQRYGSDLVFVGTWEAERAMILADLRGFNLRVWGNRWEKLSKGSRLRAHVQWRSVYCEEMSKVINSSKINLAFLRKANRDLHTSRTFEIPACGGFQLSERTEEIIGFFEEGKEIECFSSMDELKEKVSYYLNHESKRQAVAKAGLDRVRRSKYSYPDRLQMILGHFDHGK